MFFKLPIVSVAEVEAHHLEQVSSFCRLPPGPHVSQGSAVHKVACKPPV